MIPSALLESLMARTRITHFEVARPSLHDIFVRIASPETCTGACDLHADLRKIWVVASTEFGSTIRTKSFIIGIMLLPVITGASIVIQLVVAKRVDTRPRTIAVIDRTGQLYPSLERAARGIQFADGRCPGQGGPAPDRAVAFDRAHGTARSTPH